MAPDAGLSAPFNLWFVFFGQFFDHGLDLVQKGGGGTVFMPLQPDDPLFNAGPDGIPNTADDGPNFMLLTRATNQPGPDGILGTADDIHEHVNTTSPFGAIVRGTTRQVGNAIDEFKTEAMRNNLLGLPLDLGAINLARARDTGIPSLNGARREFYDMTGDSQLTPYESWVDFLQHLKHPESLINFIAAYGTHESITAATTLADKRFAATLLVFGGPGPGRHPGQWGRDLRPCRPPRLPVQHGYLGKRQSRPAQGRGWRYH